MEKKQLLLGKLNRMKRRLDKFVGAIDKRLGQFEALHGEMVTEESAIGTDSVQQYQVKIEALKGELDAAGKDFVRKKYLLERDSAASKVDMDRAQEELDTIQKNSERELNRLNEERVHHQISIEKQKSALTDLYREQRQHLLTQRERLIQQWTKLDASISEAKKKHYEVELELGDDQLLKINLLRDQIAAKKEGWSLALATIQREFASLAKGKDELEQKLSTVRADKERELEEVRIGIKVAREQLELDKATLVEKAEEDQRRCQLEVTELQNKVSTAEQELQNLIVAHEQKKKEMEDAFQKEEELLKETVRTETEKRDYEQRAFQEEKQRKEKDLNLLREEYEKKKWHWENQIRTLMMKRSVQDAEFEAEKMRVDREARVSFRSLEAKREELRQRVADLTARYDGLTTNADKEKELMNQRWQWRRDRLWTMWQTRLEMIRKERLALQEQMEVMLTTFEKEKRDEVNHEAAESKKIDDLQEFVFNMTEQQSGQRKQKEIQLELEKTRFVAQIKECEALLADWMDRLKLSQEDVTKFNSQFSGQMNFAERFFRDEEKETELFLTQLRKALTASGVSAEQVKSQQDAA